jgi:hypothetical protein
MSKEVRALINIVKTGVNNINEGYGLISLSDILSTIPREVMDNINRFNDTKKMVTFSLASEPGITIYLYNSVINKFPTSSINYPKHIYINFDYLSDVPRVVLGTPLGDNIFINVYYAILHELGHILGGHKPTNNHKSYDEYINSPEEKEAMEYADKWIMSFS